VADDDAMSVVDRPGVQRAIRIPLGLVCVVFALMCLAVAPYLLGLTVPPALLAVGLTVWLLAPPDRPSPRGATLLAGWGFGLLVVEVVVLVVVGVVSG